MKVRGAKYFFIIVLVFIVIGAVSCGMVVKDPEDINGTGDTAIVFEVTGSVDSAAVIVQGNDGSILIGAVDDNGTVQPETVSLPWTSETYEYSGFDYVFFSLSAKNTEKEERTGGTLTTYSEDHLIDSTATFSSSVSSGDYVYNHSDEISAIISEVNSNNDCSLNRVIFDESWRTYYMYQKGTPIISDTPSDTGSFLLIDDSADFTGIGVIPGLAAENETAGTFAQVVSVAATELTLDKDLFPTAQPYTVYMVKSNAAFSTTQTTNKLIDTSASFLSGAASGDVIYNPAEELYGTVLSVDSDTELTLSADVFPAVSIDYSIYAPRTLTAEIYVNGELYDSFSAEHWDTLETSLSGAIDTATIAGSGVE